jgi:acetaldehyde dehydrogenase/alcohol dehydrogenase
MPAPGYGAYVVPQKLAQAAWVLGLGGHSEETARERLFERIDALLAEVGMPRTIADTGIDPATYAAAVPQLVRDAFGDASLRTNPRMPMLSELAGLLEAALTGDV